MRLNISQTEYERRLERVHQELDRTPADALVIFGAKRMTYLSGYHVLPTERPMALVIPADANRGLIAFVPRLERDAAQRQPLIEEVWSYFEYPGEEPPLKALAGHLNKTELNKRLLVDSDGYPGLWGYQGPKLSEVLPKTTIELTRLLEAMWQIKSPEEIELIKQTALWGNLAHAKLQALTQVGTSEILISLQASYEASREMLQALGPDFGGFSRGGWPCYAGFISGPHAADPHSMSWNRLIQKGDLLVTGATGHLDGYASELERTLVVGPPSAEQRQYFEVMLEAQQAGIDACGPGVPLAEVDQAVWSVFERHQVTEYAQHHTGHHLGWEGHEPPFIDRRSPGTMQPGQIYSIEPGLYLPGHGGYRHSDTILITEDGTELLTFYPRALADLIVPAY